MAPEVTGRKKFYSGQVPQISFDLVTVLLQPRGRGGSEEQYEQQVGPDPDWGQQDGNEQVFQCPFYDDSQKLTDNKKFQEHSCLPLNRSRYYRSHKVLQDMEHAGIGSGVVISSICSSGFVEGRIKVPRHYWPRPLFARRRRGGHR